MVAKCDGQFNLSRGLWGGDSAGLSVLLPGRWGGCGRPVSDLQERAQTPSVDAQRPRFSQKVKAPAVMNMMML